MSQQTSDLFANKLRSFENELSVLVASQPSFLSLLGSTAANGMRIMTSRTPVTQHKHEFAELVMSPEQFQVSGSHTNSVTTLSLVNATGALVDMTLAFEGTDEVMKVTAVSGNNLTVVRGYGGSSVQALSDGMLIRVISRPRPEGSDPDPKANIVPTVNYNYTEIFDDTYKVSGTSVNTNLGGVNSLLNVNAQQSMIRVTRRLNAAAIYGRRVQRSTVNGVVTENGSMGGILEMVTKRINAAGVALSQTQLNDGIESIFKDGGSSDIIICNVNQARRITAFHAQQMLVLRADNTVGSSVQQFQGDLPTGAPSTILVDPNFPRTKVGLIDSQKIFLEFMQNRSLAEYDATLPGSDAVSRRILCEATLEVINGASAHAIIDNLAE
jgi:hypothetical protein